jgi:membrane protease YdiL (CAAX protease family)
MTTRTNRVVSAIIFAVLWGAGMVWQSTVIDTSAVVTAIITAAIAGLLWYWLFDKFNGLFQNKR